MAIDSAALMSSLALVSPDVRTTIAEMARRIVDHVRPERVILFGSYARGEKGDEVLAGA